LEELGVPTRRPEDYYAEMVKTDDHMRRVRQCLLSRQKMLEGKEKARKMRELKKYGKKVSGQVISYG
jgi:rRNA-processing protein EBP2